MAETSLTILLVEQDLNWGRFLKSYLEHKSINVHWVMDGQEAWRLMLTGRYNFCILNPGAPTIDGCTLAEQIRQRTNQVPIVFVASAEQDSEALRIRCFNAGADDFVARPCSVEEMVLRIKTIQKRFRFNPLEESQVFDLGKLRFDYAKQRLCGCGLNVRLTTKEADLLLALCLHRGRILERDEALLAVWKSKEHYNMRSMDVYISKLRKLLFDYTYSEIINVHSVGFKLITHRDAEFRNELRRDAGKLRKLPIRYHRAMPLAMATGHERLDAEVMESVLREPDEMLRKVAALRFESAVPGRHRKPAGWPEALGAVSDMPLVVPGLAVNRTAKTDAAAMPSVSPESDTAAPKEATPSDATDLPADAMGATPKADV
ncbi:MAG: response regulator transcription factor [Bacteroidales bacterium]|nr:response regulator transcription factor [Bacteroidales bacterium]